MILQNGIDDAFEDKKRKLKYETMLDAFLVIPFCIKDKNREKTQT